jgi:hemerythrin
MQKMQWNDELSIGIELIDSQHQQWIEHFNNMVEAIEAGTGEANIVRTLDFLVDYTNHHFSTEEKHMTSSEYPGLEHHRSKHEELTGTLGNLVEDFKEEGATHILVEAIDTFLGNWLADHIREVDMKFGDFLKEKGITIAK